MRQDSIDEDAGEAPGPGGAPEAATDDSAGEERAPLSDAVRDALRHDIVRLLPELRAFARFLVRERAEADDLVQDGVLRALGALDQFRPGTNLKAWLITILRNSFYETRRRRKRETLALQQRFAEEEAADPGQVGRSDVADLGRLLWRLPPLLREALVLVGAQELSYEEAASICGVPVGTMKARVSRGRSQLARLAGEPAGGAAPAR